MKRRSFLKNGIASGAILSVHACRSDAPQKKVSAENYIDFVLNERTISDVLGAYKNGSLSCREVARLYLNRIREIDKNGPSLNAVIEINPDVRRVAAKLDDLRKEGKLKGPLHGIPIMLKDNIDTAGNMMTTAGSLALEGNLAVKNAWVAQKLEDAGALIIAKTNLSEWANFRSVRSSSGWSGRGGQTRNPYITDRNPCGSSSGSGVAVSANLCLAAIGTETNGSIVCPASANGIVGLKPTVGLVSRAGIVPIAHSHDTSGPMSRTVEDAAIILGALTGIDPKDPYTKRSESKFYADYTRFLNKEALSGKRLGVARQFSGFHSEVDLLVTQAVKDLQDLGAIIVELDREELNGTSSDNAYEVLLYEFKHDLNKYFEDCAAPIKVRSLQELIKFNKDHSSAEMPFFGQEILIEAQKKGNLNSGRYKKALKNVLRSNGREGIDRVLDKYDIDAIIAPTGTPAWPIDVINGDHYVGGSSSPAARSGYPNITVPMGFVHGLPVGISFFAEAFSEPKLISIAYAYEQATKHRKPPEFIPTFNHQLDN
ncbi:MAG: amidase [Cytophagales bacterium]|nr:amidase [Cytophagales bacterium]